MTTEANKLSTKIWTFANYEIINISCTWVISHFSSCSDLVDEWISPIYSSDVYEQYKFSLYIKRPPTATDKFGIHLLYSDPTEILEPKINFKFSILNGNQEETNVFEQNIKIDKKASMHNIHSLEIANDLLYEDKLTICFELNVPKYANICRQPDPKPKSELNRDFGILFQNGKFTDFLLRADGKEFHVHKAILAARSQVFAAMFEHDMHENKFNYAEISDVDPEVLQEMLQFIYTGVVTKLHEMAKFLLVVADKYALESLKEMCVNKMNDQLSIETAAETLILADRHRATELKAKTLKFINENSTEVVKTEDWKNMIKTDPYLIVEAYQTLANVPTTTTNEAAQ